MWKKNLDQIEQIDWTSPKKMIDRTDRTKLIYTPAPKTKNKWKAHWHLRLGSSVAMLTIRTIHLVSLPQSPRLIESNIDKEREVKQPDYILNKKNSTYSQLWGVEMQSLEKASPTFYL